MKFWIGLAVVLLLVGGGVWYVLDHQVTDKGLSAVQKEKAMEKLLGYAPRTQQKPLEWETHKGRFISLLYPNGANIYSQGKLAAGVLDLFSYSLPAAHILVTAQVKQASDLHALADDSAVQVRLTSSDYHVKATSTTPACQEFTKNAETVEESLFCLNNSRLGSLVVTGTNAETVHKYYSMLKAAFQW